MPRVVIYVKSGLPTSLHRLKNRPGLARRNRLFMPYRLPF
jgi:hypothetical protein